MIEKEEEREREKRVKTGPASASIKDDERGGALVRRSVNRRFIGAAYRAYIIAGRSSNISISSLSRRYSIYMRDYKTHDNVAHEMTIVNSAAASRISPWRRYRNGFEQERLVNCKQTVRW